ncbi:hypothetical protein MTR_3g467210 [Medicago truncatula]|uniref:Uncharacterized protein n=1 Tax=Medicago truncatula TaxID=3880 RepID=A0A072UY43_MEDTR|nr:hypothetical protein MTR_3g467210 [Medicago truncatula]
MALPKIKDVSWHCPKLCKVDYQPRRLQDKTSPASTVRDIYRRDYVFKTILNSEETLNQKGTMVLRTLLISKGQKKVDEEKKDSSTQVKKRRREKEFPTTQ